MHEIWADIEGYDGIYKVSTLGRVLSCERIVRNGSSFRKVVEKIKSPTISRGGYLSVTLFNAGRRGAKTFYVHRLVAETFLPKEVGRGYVNHKNGVKTDASLENLEWVSFSENMVHAYENGLVVSSKGESAGKSVLKEIDVHEIRKMYKSGIPQPEIAKKFGVHQSNISLIVTGKTWRHI